MTKYFKTKTTTFLARFRTQHTNEDQGGELVSAGMWIILNSYLNWYGKFSILPYSLADRSIHVVQLKNGTRFIMKIWSLWGPFHSVLCFYFLMSTGKNPHQLDDYADGVLSYVRPLVLLYVGFLPLVVTGISYIISFCSENVPSLINPIQDFERKFIGRLHSLLLIFYMYVIFQMLKFSKSKILKFLVEFY